MSVQTKMTAIADKIRTLSGTTDPMGLDAMATNVGDANTAIDSQADLIQQIKTTLEGKAAGGSEPVEFCTYRYTNNAGYSSISLMYLGEKDGKTVIIPTSVNPGSTASFTVVKNSYVIHDCDLSLYTMTINGEPLLYADEITVGRLTAIYVDGDKEVIATS